MDYIIPGWNSICFRFKVADAQEVQHERIVRCQKRNAVVNPNRCHEGVVIKCGVGLACDGGVHRAPGHSGFGKFVAALQRIYQTVKMIERVHVNVFKFLRSKPGRNFRPRNPVFRPGSSQIHPGRRDQNHQEYDGTDLFCILVAEAERPLDNYNQEKNAGLRHDPGELFLTEPEQPHREDHCKRKDRKLSGGRGPGGVLRQQGEGGLTQIADTVEDHQRHKRDQDFWAGVKRAV